jgi:hypothetical protein
MIGIDCAGVLHALHRIDDLHSVLHFVIFDGVLASRRRKRRRSKIKEKASANQRPNREASFY